MHCSYAVPQPPRSPICSGRAPPQRPPPRPVVVVNASSVQFGAVVNIPPAADMEVDEDDFETPTSSSSKGDKKRFEVKKVS